MGDLDLACHYTSVALTRIFSFPEEVVVMEGVAHFIDEQKVLEITIHTYDFIKGSYSVCCFPSFVTF